MPVYNRQKVIDVALSQVGYKEKNSNENLDNFTANAGDQNWTKYARDLDAMSKFYNGRKNGFAWCDVFVDWCFVQAYGRTAAQYLLCQLDDSAGAGCSFSAQYFRNNGQFHISNPQPGDQIFFGASANNVWHTGLVVGVDSNRVYTVEGNTSDSVAKRSYMLQDSSIYGYGRPNWGTEELPVDEPSDMPAPLIEPTHTYNIPVPLLDIGDKGSFVKSVQTLLIERGYNCGNKTLIGREKPDGDFGPSTEKAVSDFQRKFGLDIDGEVGGETWLALLGNWG